MTTKGAMMAAAVILDGKATLTTAYGKKTAHGIAALIADKTSAPDLLEALRECLSYVPLDGDVERDIRERAEDAIRKAMGE